MTADRKRASLKFLPGQQEAQVHADPQTMTHHQDGSEFFWQGKEQISTFVGSSRLLWYL